MGYFFCVCACSLLLKLIKPHFIFYFFSVPEAFIVVTWYLGTVLKIKSRNRTVYCVQCSDIAVKNQINVTLSVLLKKCLMCLSGQSGINPVDSFLGEKRHYLQDSLMNHI